MMYVEYATLAGLVIALIAAFLYSLNEFKANDRLVSGHGMSDAQALAKTVEKTAPETNSSEKAKAPAGKS